MAVQSLKAILRTLTSFINTVVNSTDNPTNVTAAQAGAYTKGEVDTLLTAKLSTTALPLAVFGDGTVGGVLNVSVNARTLTVPTTKALLGGVAGTVGGVLNFTGLPVNTVRYVSLEMQGGNLVLQLNDRPVVESNIIMAIGTVKVTGVSSISFTGFEMVVRIAGYRLSRTRAPNSIPISDANGSISAWQ